MRNIRPTKPEKHKAYWVLRNIRPNGSDSEEYKTSRSDEYKAYWA